jgi:hypothetical protein
VVYSDTELGHLLSGISGTSPFSSTGSLSFNTFGQVFASPSNQGGASALVGTYTVNADCTVSVALTDTFGENKTETNLFGIILNGGNEVDLFAMPAAGTGATSSPAAGIQSRGALLIRLLRPFFSNFGCTAGNLTGAYALVLNGIGSGGGTTSGPQVLIARAVFDGAGNIITDGGAAGSPLVAVQSIGTYAINSDCTGTMTLKSGASSTSTTTPVAPSPATTVNFALTAPTIVANIGATNLSQYSTRPGLALSSSNTIQTASGSGTAQ